MKKLSSKLLLLLIIATLIGCTIGVKQSFLITQKSFNDAATAYFSYKDTVTAEEKAKLDKEVTPLVVEALMLVYSMNEVVRMGATPSTVSENAFKDLRYELYKKLPNIFKKGD